MYLELSGTVNHNHFEKIIQLITSKNEEHLLNLEKVSFIEPYGLVGLITAFRYCKAKGIELKLNLPSNGVQSYMATMDFFERIQEYGRIPQGIVSRFQLRRPERPLLELRKITMSGFTEIVKFTELLDQRMGIMFNKSEDELMAKRITTNFIEVCQNIEHSLDYGYVAAQKYKDPHMVKIGVMDLGIGIAQALKSNYEKKGEILTDRRAISLALLPQVSSRPTGGGLGLYHLSLYVKEHIGSELTIRSGTVRVVLKHTGSTYTENLRYFPGTQVGLTIKLLN